MDIKIEQLLLSKINPAALPIIDRYTKDFIFDITIRNPRKTKLGDYKFNKNLSPNNIISVNSDLPKDFFLLVLAHEVAHMLTFNRYHKRVKPHGKEWKAAYVQIMNDLLIAKCFENQNIDSIKRHLSNPPASCSGISHLIQQLYPELYQKNTKTINIGSLTVQDLKPNDSFVFKNRKFKLIKKMRTRYRCQEIKTGRIYSFFSLAEIKKISE